ncbi:MAG: hypothetical protein K940chlam7_00610 [Chlamydiae bacterium]|nr:hypothetical protein [Chlamydiota bacterium]
MAEPIRLKEIPGSTIVDLPNLDDNSTKNPTKPQALFEKIVLDTSKGVPTDLNGNKIDLSGCIAITRDTKHKGILHILIWVAQKIHSFLFGRRNTDANLVHTSIILKSDGKKEKPDHLVLAHALLGGIHTTSQSYFNKKDERVTEFVVWRPIDPKLQELLLKHADQTVFNKKREEQEGVDYRIRKAGFGIVDMIGSTFRSTSKTPSQGAISRTANVVADLLLGNQILDKKGEKPHQFFCTPYVMSVLQGSLLIQALSDENKEKLLHDEDGNTRSREELAHIIYCKISQKSDASTISKAYWNSRICQLNARYLQSCYAADALDEVSNLVKVSQT